jgi:hypothetical protein
MDNCVLWNRKNPLGETRTLGEVWKSGNKAKNLRTLEWARQETEFQPAKASSQGREQTRLKVAARKRKAAADPGSGDDGTDDSESDDTAPEHEAQPRNTKTGKKSGKAAKAKSTTAGKAAKAPGAASKATEPANKRPTKTKNAAAVGSENMIVWKPPPRGSDGAAEPLSKSKKRHAMMRTLMRRVTLHPRPKGRRSRRS